MEPEVVRHRLEPWADINEMLGDSLLQTLSIGYDGDVYTVTIDQPYEFYQDKWGHSIVKPAGAQKWLNYSVLHIHDHGTIRTKIEVQNRDYYFAQPLPDDELLVVDSRARENGKLINGHVFSGAGKFDRGFTLGDAIEDVQTTKDGFIWASYFDEAIGNENWGLIKWDAHGDKRVHIRDRMIADCYALNVAGRNDIWFYYYGGFELVQLRDDREANYWEVPVAGSDCFAIWKHLALFDAGYNHHREYYVLLEMKDDHLMEEIIRIAFVDGEDNLIQPQVVAMRGSMIVLLQGTTLYRAFVYELAEEIGR